MITFDESEYMSSTVSDCTLRAVAFLLGKEAADSLLYRSECHGLDTTWGRTIHKVRTEPDDSDYVFDIFSEAAESPAPVAQVSALAHSG